MVKISSSLDFIDSKFFFFEFSCLAFRCCFFFKFIGFQIEGRWPRVQARFRANARAAEGSDLPGQLQVARERRALMLTDAGRQACLVVRV